MSMTLKEEFTFIGFFYIMAFIYWISIGLMGAYWTLYFVNLDLTYSVIALILLMHPISSLIFEIPSGSIADIFGRKISVFFSYLLSGLAFIGILLSGSKLFYLLVFYFLGGISYTMETGALEAWFVDTIEYNKKSENLHRLFGRWGSISSIGFSIGAFLGGILVTYGIDKAFWATTTLMLFLAFFVLFFSKEEYFKKRNIKVIQGFKEAFKAGKEGLQHTFKQPVILSLTIIMTLLTFSNSISYNAYQPYVIKVGLQPQLLGFALSITGFISIFSLNYSHKIAKYVGGNRNSLTLFTFLFGLAILGVGIIKYLPLLFLSLIAYSSFYEFSANTAPAYRELFNKYVPSTIRATVISINSFNMRIGDIIGLIIFGLISDYWNLQAGIIFAGTLITAISFIYPISIDSKKIEKS